DRRRRLTRLREEIAHARRPYANERLDEVRARQREERRVGFAGDGLGEQRLASPWRTDKQHTLGSGGPDAQILAGIGQEVADLAQLGHRLSCSGDVGEGDLFSRPLTLATALAGEAGEARDAASAAVGAESCEEREQTYQQQ